MREKEPHPSGKRIQKDDEGREDVLDPRHLYVAYIFDQVETQGQDIKTLVEQAQKLGYPVRYWWYSETRDLHGYPDRLFVCVHHPSEDEGLDLFETMKEQLIEQRVSWDDLEPFKVEVYSKLGKPIEESEDVHWPDGNALFPEETTQEDLRDLLRKAGIIYVITRDDIQAAAWQLLGRDLTAEEFDYAVDKFEEYLEWLDWVNYLDEAIMEMQKGRPEGPDIG